MNGKNQVKVAAGFGLNEPGPDCPGHISHRPRPEQLRQKQPTLAVQTLLTFGRKLVAGYNKLQVSHRGMYSIERLHAYQAYCEKTSVARAIAVCVLTPLPSLLAIILIECFPLRDPLLGWEANYMFWIRFYLSGVIVFIGCSYQATDMVDRVKISPLQRLGMSMVAMSIYVGTLMLVSHLWVFPVPFGIVLGIGPCFAVFLVALVITIGPKTFKSNPGLGEEIKLQLYVLAVEGFVSVLYPAFSSVYLRASSTGRAGLVLLLPVIKILMKNVVAWSSSHVEDCIPVVTVFSIEVFNALYVATCMQSTKSTLATVIIIVSDVLNVILAFRSLLHRSRALEEEHRRSLPAASADSKHESVALISTVMTSFHHLRTFKTQKGKEIRVRSPVKLGIATDTDHVLDTLAEHHNQFVTNGARKVLRAASKLRAVSRGSASAKASEASKIFVKEFVPAEAPPGPPESHHVLVKQSDTLQVAGKENLELIEGTLQLLFYCEYHALVEYVECAVPILFGVYLSILYQLPAHEYYPHTRDLEAGQLEGMLASLSIYVTLEVLSFVGMHMALKRKFSLSALYQLAFVLETHVVQLQSRMFVWIVFILQFTLAHYGVDFTFQFAWLP